jgi:hypothetical protein
MRRCTVRASSMAVRPNGRAFAFLAAIALACSCSVHAEQSVTATVEQPRAFGQVLGDVLSQRVLLEINGRDAGEVTPPSNGRINVWFERRKPHVEIDGEGRRWMVIDYLTDVRGRRVVASCRVANQPRTADTAHRVRRRRLAGTQARPIGLVSTIGIN